MQEQKEEALAAETHKYFLPGWFTRRIGIISQMSRFQRSRTMSLRERNEKEARMDATFDVKVLTQ